MKENIKIIKIDNEQYPKQLKNIPNKPRLLYTLGNIELFNTYGIAIIGSRKCSKQGAEMAKQFARELALNGITIISGMAEGIDTAAHQGALEVGGNTIAVLGNGFKKIFPKKNINLFHEIVEKGLVVSEYPEYVEAKSEYFLKRNRIVSGLSIGILIIEAMYRSGTSVTARLAEEQKREIFCIPHAINDRRGIGTNRLIKNGAKLVTEPREIIEEFSFLNYDEENIEKLKKIRPKVKKEYQEVFKFIGEKPIEAEEICHKARKKIQEVNAILLMMEIEGVVKKVEGGYVCVLSN